MFIFELLVFSAVIVLIYLYWDASFNIPHEIQDGKNHKNTKEGFTNNTTLTPQSLPNITMCPAPTKSFVQKNGDTLCCDGNPAGTECEGTTVCTLSSTTSKNMPSCATYLMDLYIKRGAQLCPKTIPNYYINNSGKALCTVSKLNNELNGPNDLSADKCTISAGKMKDPDSCEVKVALDKMPCPSRGCKKVANSFGANHPVVLSANFKDSMNIMHNCYDTNSAIGYLRSIFGEEWKSKLSHINIDRNIMFCNVAKKYFIDKTLTKKDIDI